MNTIFAQCTAPGKAGVAIFRLSGLKSFESLEQIIDAKLDGLEPRKVYFKRIYNPKTKKLYLFFKGKINKNLSYKEELKDFFKQNNQSKILKNLNLAISTLILIDEAKKSKINNMKKTLLNFKNV